MSSAIGESQKSAIKIRDRAAPPIEEYSATGQFREIVEILDRSLLAWARLFSLRSRAVDYFMVRGSRFTVPRPPSPQTLQISYPLEILTKSPLIIFVAVLG